MSSVLVTRLRYIECGQDIILITRTFFAICSLRMSVRLLHVYVTQEYAPCLVQHKH